jgi:hypothetical protein
MRRPDPVTNSSFPDEPLHGPVSVEMVFEVMSVAIKGLRRGEAVGDG